MAINTICTLCGREASHRYLELEFPRDDGGKWCTCIECPRCGLYPIAPDDPAPAANPQRAAETIAVHTK